MPRGVPLGIQGVKPSEMGFSYAPVTPQVPAAAQMPAEQGIQAANLQELLRRQHAELMRRRHATFQMPFMPPPPSGAELIARASRTTGSLMHGNPQ